MRLLVTRPEPEATRTAAALRRDGHIVVVAPLLSIEPLPDAEIGPGTWAAILVTSAHAAKAINAHPSLAALRSLPVFAVGERSAAAMRDAGFDDVTTADGDRSALVHLVAERTAPDAPLLYLAGLDRSGDLPGELAEHGFAVHTAVIYRARAAAALPPAAAEALARGIDGVLHFSRRTAEIYVNVTVDAGVGDSALTKPMHFCISQQVAAPLRQAGARDIRIAARPLEVALLTLIPPA